MEGILLIACLTPMVWRSCQRCQCHQGGDRDSPRAPAHPGSVLTPPHPPAAPINQPAQPLAVCSWKHRIPKVWGGKDLKFHPVPTLPWAGTAPTGPSSPSPGQAAHCSPALVTKCRVTPQVPLGRINHILVFLFFFSFPDSPFCHPCTSAPPPQPGIK